MKNKNIRIVKIIIAILAFFLYFNTLSAEFVYDDTDQVINNPWIRDVSYVPDIFFSNVWSFLNEDSQSSYYRPLMHLQYMVIYHVFGEGPFGFHFVNVLFHIGVSILVFLIALRLFNSFCTPPSPCSNFKENKIAHLLQLQWSLIPAALAGILFAAHPIHTEAVAWIAALPELSCAFFFLLSFYLYIKRDDKEKISCASLFFFFLSALSKEPALTLPVVLFFYELAIHFVAQETFCVGLGQGMIKALKKIAKNIAPFIGVAGIYFLFRSIALNGLFTNPLNPEFELTNYEYFINIFPLFIDYIGKLLAPINFNAFYGFDPIYSLMNIKGFLALILVVLLVFVWIKTWSRDKLVFFNLAWIAIPLLPALYLPAISGGAYFAERYLYLPSVGFVILVAYFVDQIIKKNIKNLQYILIGAIIIILGFYSWMTIKRNVIWQHEYTLLIDIINKSPEVHVPHNRLGFHYQNQGKIDEAIEQYKIAIDLKPDYVDAYYNLGNSYQEIGNIELAIKNYKKAIEIHPNYAQVYNNMGIIAIRSNDLNGAKEYMEKAVSINPNYGEALTNLGLVYRYLGDIDKAIEYHEQSLKIFTDHLAYYTLGRDYQLKNECREAIKYYKLALKVNPNFSQASQALVGCQGK